MGATRKVSAGAAVIALVSAGAAVLTAPGAAAADWGRCLDGTADRQAVFARAASVSGVPEEVLLGVAYMGSRWDDHGSSPSTSSGYGPMHLVQVDPDAKAEEHSQGKGEGAHDDGQARRAEATDSPGVNPAAEGLTSLADAADILGVADSRLKQDEVANICGGAALLASYQRKIGAGEGTGRVGDWSAAVAKYSGAGDQATAKQFAEQVFTVIREGRTRTTNDGHRVTLAPTRATVDQEQVESLDLTVASTEGVDCPVGLACESIPAPYEHYGSTPGAYGNHDLANRQADMDIDYIIIHDTEATWDTTLDLVTRPTYLAWNYSLRSVDGHIAQHLDKSDVGWHAGNWYVNMHSIGLEHEGFAAQGSSWYTESMYQTSAALVRHLADKYDVPLDRAHIIGHDQIPGHIPSRVPAMHWDPGPYWDWEHYFDLLGAPIKADRTSRSDIVTVAPGFEGNEQPLTSCGSKPCRTDATNFVYLRQAPDASAPLVNDPGLRSDGSPQTTRVSDIGARAAAGQKLLVAKRSGDWLGVWWLGDIAWLYSPKDAPRVVPSDGQVVVTAGDSEVPVYGRAYPESSAYPDAIPDQGVVPMQYTIKPGQAYVLADADIQTDYYYAKTYNCEYLELDCTQVVGQDEYYLIWLGHRMHYVRAADVEVKDGVARLL
ncbi:MAG TPA: N-acetylmuramoyl-L-alanine amidase [Nocardioidaceae bacterium]|nr:N-acetylmuramoyl-L-alanine amidase [Nocardioidaceae bacterium]